MKNVNPRPAAFTGDSFRGLLVGSVCGAILTLSLLVGTGRLLIHQQPDLAPTVVVQDVMPNAGVSVKPIKDTYGQHLSQRFDSTATAPVTAPFHKKP